MKKNSTFQYILLWALVGIVTGLAVLFVQGKIIITGVDWDGFNLNGTEPPKSYSDAVSRAAPAVVTLYVQSLVEVPIEEKARTQLEQIFGTHLPNLTETRLRNSSGSGVILDKRGYVITNHHVIAKAEKIIVKLIYGRSAEA
jgi:S1-C subfamily serine protease